MDPKLLFKCGLCGLNTYNQNLLQDHMNTHTGAKPYECELCGHRTCTRYALYFHTKTKHKITPKGRPVIKMKVQRTTGETQQ